MFRGRLTCQLSLPWLNAQWLDVVEATRIKLELAMTWGMLPELLEALTCHLASEEVVTSAEPH